jgi:hypothetical protein
VRIISKFRDYYDSVQAHGIDPALVYERITRTVKPEPHLWKHPKLLELGMKMPRNWDWDISGHLVLFCGRLFPLWKYEEQWLWNSDEIATVLAKRQSRTDIHRYDKPQPGEFEERQKHSLFLSSIRGWLGISRVEIDGFLDAFGGAHMGPEVHLEFNAPVLMVTMTRVYGTAEIEVIVNPRLDDVRFFTQVDAFTAYQEIAMYLGNQLAQPDIAPQVVGDDETLARAKGFDEKSFRTQAPGSKKLNRKANRARKKKSQ